ncbi:hypothetical protein VFPPC_05768 [Pochonia chlamydosporia 170]|uniref:Uncharacterized protein n=1 Tax=Pochonia chlamydosporia 170 TaxID=1380566 RepID=A0A179FHM1_METCM|nr:hypothetical protein VFPPC_05768 [Pochonia chlamydosporia 170]OAQ64503.1 hypothetical protein VFPPC_05768 [Pochonia chlamydosporia 170]
MLNKPSPSTFARPNSNSSPSPTSSCLANVPKGVSHCLHVPPLARASSEPTATALGPGTHITHPITGYEEHDWQSTNGMRARQTNRGSNTQPGGMLIMFCTERQRSVPPCNRTHLVVLSDVATEDYYLRTSDLLLSASMYSVQYIPSIHSEAELPRSLGFSQEQSMPLASRHCVSRRARFPSCPWNQQRAPRKSFAASCSGPLFDTDPRLDQLGNLNVRMGWSGP